MRKRLQFLTVLLICVTSFGLAGCGLLENGGGASPPQLGDNYSGANDKLADFTVGLSDKFYPADRWGNGGMFDCRWSADNVVYNSAKKAVELSFSKAANGENIAGEYRTKNFYGYGYYSVYMKAVKKPGVVSSFFTYTGSSDGNDWDEIDIEFLGKDTTKVQFNYFTGGEGGHEKLYDLGFDASLEFHEYGFLWKEDSITWYVDSLPVYRATDNIPSTPGRIMINAWPGKAEGEQNVASWSGVFDGVYPIAPAEYKWIGFKSQD